MKKELFVLFILLILVGYRLNQPMQVVLGQDVQVISSRIDVQIVQSQVNGLYYIQCVDTCDLWYQTGDIADLYVGFGLQCAAMNHWTLQMSKKFDYPNLPLPCPPES